MGTTITVQEGGEADPLLATTLAVTKKFTD